MARPFLLAAATALLALPATAFDMGDMTVEEREAFRSEIRAYLLENPEVLMEAIGVLQEREAAAQAASEADLLAALQDDIYNDGHSWVGGNPAGDVTLVEFLDYRCGYCKRAHPEVTALVEGDGNIRRIVKEYPILGEASVLAARFALSVKALAGDDAYKATHDALMTLRGDLTEDTLARVATDLSLDPAAILAGMSDPAIDAALEANRALGEALRISGTPTFILDGQFVRGYLPADALKALVDEARG